MSDLKIAGMHWRTIGSVLVAYGRGQRPLGYPINQEIAHDLGLLIAEGFIEQRERGDG